jgi:putative transposase
LFGGALNRAGWLGAKRRSDRPAELPIKQHSQSLVIRRGAVYNQIELVSEAEPALLRRIDELYLEHAFAGSRILRGSLSLRSIRALYRKPNTGKRLPALPTFPYALRGEAIGRANHVLALDITYIRMATG